jgi:23S rRNA (pseudouridine1915-N3)-methyltransferase
MHSVPKGRDMTNWRMSHRSPENGYSIPRGRWPKHRAAGFRSNSIILQLVELTLTHVGARSDLADGFEDRVNTYLQRCAALARCNTQSFRSQEALLEWLDRRNKPSAEAVLLDSRGKQMSSESFAGWLGAQRDRGVRHMVFAVGPASGWSDAARGRAQLLLSLGPLTLPHGLARLVIAEQIYRACTILTGHPYHLGH